MRFKQYLKQCDRCKRTFNTTMLLHCTPPRVQEHFGENICLYCCKGCKHHTTVPFFDGVGCGYERED